MKVSGESGRDGGDDHRIHVEGGRLLGAGGEDGGQGRGQRQGAGNSKLVFCMTVRLCLCMSDGRARADAARAGRGPGMRRKAAKAGAGYGGRKSARARADRAIRPGTGQAGRAAPRGPAAGGGGSDCGAGGATEATAAAGKAGSWGSGGRSRVWCATIQNGHSWAALAWPAYSPSCGPDIADMPDMAGDGARVHQRRHHAGRTAGGRAEADLQAALAQRGGVRHVADRHQRARSTVAKASRHSKKRACDPVARRDGGLDMRRILSDTRVRAAQPGRPRLRCVMAHARRRAARYSHELAGRPACRTSRRIQRGSHAQ